MSIARWIESEGVRETVAPLLVGVWTSMRTTGCRRWFGAKINNLSKQSRPASLRMQAVNDVVRCPIELTDSVAEIGYPHAIR